LPAYEGLPQATAARRRNVVSYRLSPLGVNLPCGMSMTAEKVDYVCRMLIQILQSAR
jgi:perosamine synthetase